ncbi:MAG: hypothetical protein HY326_01060 [Chloroflexi bacterium]|nr:hypothetical protein [Chloroflexota bacterium]
MPTAYTSYSRRKRSDKELQILVLGFSIQVRPTPRAAGWRYAPPIRAGIPRKGSGWRVSFPHPRQRVMLAVNRRFWYTDSIAL